VSQGRERFHAAWGDNHSIAHERSAGEARADVVDLICVVRKFPDLIGPEVALDLDRLLARAGNDEMSFNAFDARQYLKQAYTVNNSSCAVDPDD
jgi:hypothetical protein